MVCTQIIVSYFVSNIFSLGKTAPPLAKAWGGGCTIPGLLCDGVLHQISYVLVCITRISNDSQLFLLKNKDLIKCSSKMSSRINFGGV